MEERGQHEPEHFRIQEIQRHADARKGTSDADHAQLIEVVSVGVVVMFVWHMNDLQ
jgi:hypothetical protein